MNDKFQPDGNYAEAELEQRLRDLYRGEDPPASLTARILVRARGPLGPAHHARLAANWWRRHAPLLSLSTALLAVCAYVTIGVAHGRQVKARRALVAQANLVYALQVTAGELNWAEGRITRDLAEPATPPRLRPLAARRIHQP
ncbi:MAG: hypothetical protein ACRD1C_01225 [Terriglobales bacterium]